MEKKKTQNIYLQAQRLATITKSFITNGHIQRAKRCFLVAENLFNKGNKQIQNAISNVYVYSVSSFMEMHHYKIQNFFPKALQSEYQKQINTSGV